MKHLELTPLVFVISTLSCNQKAEIKEDLRQNIVSHAYSATDKTRAKATFLSSEKENTITIEANRQKFVLDKKGENYYERNGVSARVTNDSLFIEQGETVIPLKKVD